MPARSIKHTEDKRPLIPSIEAAGSEAGNPKVLGAGERISYPVNPVVTRGQDPELFWVGKYGADDQRAWLQVDIRSLYRHEHIAPEALIQRLYRRVEKPVTQPELLTLFGDGPAMDEYDKVGEYYTHADDWTNRLIQGDSLLVMTSLLEREGFAGKVQCVYIDPPYGVKYNSNWQIKLNNTKVTDGQDESLTGEPEQVKAYRDTWELGIHSYLGYLRDRLLVAHKLLHESGSCFVQISDENVHLVRCLMDEVFGAGNCVVTIIVKKKSTTTPTDSINDYVLWYAKDREIVRKKVKKLYIRKSRPEDDPKFNTLM